MAEAYRSLKATLPAAEADTLLNSQRQWIKSRENRCSWVKPARLTQCAIEETDKRWRTLAGLPEAGPGTGRARLRPVLIARDGDASHYAVDISAVLFAQPRTRGERVFNRAIRHVYADAPLDKKVDFQSPGPLSYNLSIEVTYASPDFISALASGWRYDGGAHGNSYTSVVNVDLRAGRLLTFADLFAPSAHAAFVRRCRHQVIVQKRAKMNESAAAAASDLEQYRHDLHKIVGNLSNWSFGEHGVEITFDAYALGSYAEGEYTCHIGNRILHRYANPAVALPR